jgi:hypothetical protein
MGSNEALIDGDCRKFSRWELSVLRDAVLFRGVIKPWNNSRVSELAGDRVWHADFTGLEKPGTYHLYDPTTKVRSYPFRIADYRKSFITRGSTTAHRFTTANGADLARHPAIWSAVRTSFFP